jgi:hypothetical protein
MVAAVTIFSCENESDNKGSFKDLSDEAKSYLRMSHGNSVATDGLNSTYRPGSPMNVSFQGLYNMAKGINNGRMAGDSSTTQSDTTIYSDPWITCGQITTSAGQDGSVTTTYDYGDGCEQGNSTYKYWMKGKYSYTYLNNYVQNGSSFKDTYSYSNSFDNYGGTYYYDNDSTVWLTNGTSNMQGESTYDTAAQTFTGNYTSDYNFTYVWNNVNYAYSGSGKSYYSTNQFVEEKNVYSYSDGDNYYKSEVIEPLVMQYDCNTNRGSLIPVDVLYYWTYVSGKEVVHYKQDGKEGAFEIDYGNGSCDNIVTVIEDGKRVDVDLSNAAIYTVD